MTEDRLFAVPVATMQERRQARRESIPQRVGDRGRARERVRRAVGRLVRPQRGIRGAAQAIPDAVEVTGLRPRRRSKEARLLAFSNGDARVIVTKPSIAGWGLNWQHCAECAFRRALGFLRAVLPGRPALLAVRADTARAMSTIVASNREQAVLENVRRKEAQAMEMFEEIVEAMRG